jgi:hypothetical protein
MLRATSLPTYLFPFPISHLPILERRLSTKKQLPATHTHPHTRSFSPSNGDPGPQIPSVPQNPLAWGVVRCGAVRYARKQRIPTFGPDSRRARAQKQRAVHKSHDCAEGLVCREGCVGGCRPWRFLALVSSRRRLGTYVYMRVRDVCRRGGMPCLGIWAYWCTVVSIMVRSLGDGQMGLCGGCTTRMSETGCVSKWLGERRGRREGLGLDV